MYSLISYNKYNQGYMLYAIDLTPNLATSKSHNSIRKIGNIVLAIKFCILLPGTVTFIGYTEYRNVIEIDKTRSIFTNY